MSETREIALTVAWQRITTGTENVTLQCRTSKFAICSNSSTPSADAPYQVYQEAVVTAPTVAWVKCFSPGHKLIIAEA